MTTAYDQSAVSSDLEFGKGGGHLRWSSSLFESVDTSGNFVVCRGANAVGNDDFVNLGQADARYDALGAASSAVSGHLSAYDHSLLGKASVTDDIATVTSVYPLWAASSSGGQATKVSSSKLSFVPSTGILTATGFAGPLTGNVTGNCSGSSGSCTGNAATVTNGVTASAVIADNVLVRGDGGARGIQGSGITVDDSNNIFGVVGITATGKIATTLTTEQLRLAYDATHYAPFTVGSTGILTIAPYNAGAASYVSIMGRLGVGTAAPAAVIEAALSAGVIGVKGTSDSTYGGYFISSSGTGLRGDSTSGTGVYGLSSSYYGGWFASTTSRGIYVTTRSGIGAYVRKTGTLTASESSEMLYLLRDVDGASSYATTGNLITINDGPTNCTSISGYMLTAIFSGTERVRWNPRVTDGASAVAYFDDTANALATSGAKIRSFRTNAVEKAYIGGGGEIYGAGAFGCNGATPRTSATANALSAYATGAYGFDSNAHAQEIHTLLGQIRTALINNGIMVSA